MQYKDWAVTANFYAAVHLAEAMFAKKKGWHADQERGEESAHAWRTRAIMNNCSFIAWTKYEYLDRSSRAARYLVEWRAKGSTAIAMGYFSDSDVRTMVESDLPTFAKEIGYTL